MLLDEFQYGNVSWLDIIVILIAIWIVIYVIAIRVGKKYFAPYGPALLIKTQAGIRTIDKVSRTKFWDYFVSFFYYAVPVFGILTVILLIWEAFLILSIPKSSAVPLSYALALPGINPVIPIGYGVVGLIVAVALHEISHGIAARRSDIPLRSTGILWFIIPVGAFVEPDEEVMKQREPKVRGKVFAAGPGMNLTLAAIFIVIALLLAYSIVPANGAPVQSSINPALRPGDIIQSVNNVSIESVSALMSMSLTPGSIVPISVIRDGKLLHETTIYGVYIVGVVGGYPASDAGIEVGSIVLTIGGKSITNLSTFENVLSNYKAGQEVTITSLYNSSYHSYNVTLASKYNYLISIGSSNPGVPRSYPFLGVQVDLLGISPFDQNAYLNTIRNPLSSGVLAIFYYLGLPFYYEMPLPSVLQSSLIASPIVLNLEYLSYWLFWLNFALGLTNILPLVPLDGGYVLLNIPFLQKNQKLRNSIVAFVGLAVLFLIVWQLVIPRI